MLTKTISELRRIHGMGIMSQGSTTPGDSLSLSLLRIASEVKGIRRVFQEEDNGALGLTGDDLKRHIKDGVDAELLSRAVQERTELMTSILRGVYEPLDIDAMKTVAKEGTDGPQC